MTPEHPPRVRSVRSMKWLLNLFPPLLFNRIRVTHLSDDFRECRVRVSHSLLTRNLQGTTFGGTIFSATDPYFAIMYWQILAHRGVPVKVWLRSSSIRYLKPAATALTLKFVLTEEDVQEAIQGLERTGRFVKTHTVDALNAEGVVCATATNEVYLRTPGKGQREASSF